MQKSSEARHEDCADGLEPLARRAKDRHTGSI